MKNLLWYLFASTRGGEMRAKMINSLKQKPKNAHQLSKDLKVDYKTIQHHLKILYENSLITVMNKGEYGATYFLSSIIEDNMKELEEIWKRFGKK